jgi:hypothetical protein
MISVEGGAQVDYFLRLKTLDAESTSAPSVSEIVVTKAADCASSNLYWSVTRGSQRKKLFGIWGSTAAIPKICWTRKEKRRTTMSTENERQVKEFAEIKSAEMTQIQGGAWYAKFDGVDGSSKIKDHKDHVGAGIDAGYSNWRTNFGRTSW